MQPCVPPIFRSHSLPIHRQPKSFDAEGAEEKGKGRHDTLCDLCETSASSALRLLPWLVLPVR